MAKSEEVLHDNENDDTNSLDTLSDEDRTLFRKFVDFVKGATASVEASEVETEEVTKIEDGGDTPDMTKEELTAAVTEAVEELNKSVDGKFSEVGDSLTKVAEALEKLATVDALDEVKKSIEEGIAELTGRVETLENSGAVKKSAEDEGAEKLEKSDEVGLWSNSIVPEFLKKQVNS